MVIDFHNHIIPQIDDGSQSVLQTRWMLQRQQQQVDAVVATPHFYADQDRIERFLARRQEGLDRMEEIKPWNVSLYVGAEVLFFSGISQAMDIEKLCIEGTSLLLLEMPFMQWDDAMRKEIERLMQFRKLTVILAHIERYEGLQRKRRYFEEILRLPVIGQVNAGPFLKLGKRALSLKLLKSGKGQLLGSDCHNQSTRVPNLSEGRQVIERKLGKEYLTRIDDLGTMLLKDAKVYGS